MPKWQVSKVWFLSLPLGSKSGVGPAAGTRAGQSHSCAPRAPASGTPRGSSRGRVPVIARRISVAAASLISSDACSLYQAVCGVQIRLGASFNGP